VPTIFDKDGQSQTGPLNFRERDEPGVIIKFGGEAVFIADSFFYVELHDLRCACFPGDFREARSGHDYGRYAGGIVWCHPVAVVE